MTALDRDRGGHGVHGAPCRWLAVASLLLTAACAGHRGRPAALPTPTASATTSSTVSPSGSVPEAELAGDPTWRITRLGGPHAIEGWADRVSVLPGVPVGLHVSTTAVTWRVTAYRMGWYRGALARRVWRSGPERGVVQGAASVLPGTLTVVTSWPVSLQVPTVGWPPGAYLLRLDAVSGEQRFVPLTVRSPSTAGRLVLLDAVTSWQAYNAWGGLSLYHGTGGEADFSGRSRAVSFDRPYDKDGSGDFVGLELPVIAHAERLGIPLAYATDVDLHAVGGLLGGARGLVSLGHDEYWSSAMRSAATVARDRGVNIAFLGANAVFRHIRLAATAAGPDRLEICYKRTAGDPLYGKDNAEVTVDWREPPLPRPESTLTGTFYECNPVQADFVVTDPGNWLFAGTGAYAGQRLPRLIGPEYDRVNPGVSTPHDIEVLSHSPVRCRGVASFADSAYYTVASGAGVFDSGTSGFVGAVPEAGATGPTSVVVGGLITNLMRAFVEGPVGLVHPARRNVDALHEYSGDPIAAGHH